MAARQNFAQAKIALFLQTDKSSAQDGDLAVWWIPQVPMEAMWIPVGSPEEGWKFLEILGKYDLFQLKHKVKPDFSNVGGLSVFKDGEWIDWEFETDNESLDAYMDELYGVNG